jgi:hypothetical protein
MHALHGPPPFASADFFYPIDSSTVRSAYEWLQENSARARCVCLSAFKIRTVFFWKKYTYCNAYNVELIYNSISGFHKLKTFGYVAQLIFFVHYNRNDVETFGRFHARITYDRLQNDICSSVEIDVNTFNAILDWYSEFETAHAAANRNPVFRHFFPVEWSVSTTTDLFTNVFVFLQELLNTHVYPDDIIMNSKSMFTGIDINYDPRRCRQVCTFS